MSSPCSLSVFACSTNGLVVIPPQLSRALISFFQKAGVIFITYTVSLSSVMYKQYKHAPTSLAVSLSPVAPC